MNKGIRETIRTEPTRFMAYNNGISATAEYIELSALQGGGMAIQKIVGLQIVNGGQTVASIHRAAFHDRMDISQICVQAKLTIIKPEHVETLVPLVSKYANVQNRVNEADLSANHAFHVELQKLADTIWCPGEQTRWFYERARGQYEVAKAREATTPVRKRRFEAATPIKQRFDKTDLAKFLNAWDQLPHIVGRGSQKNFTTFMDRLAVRYGPGWLPDAEFFKDAVSKALIYKAADSVARRHAFSSYRANAIAYTVALLSYRTAGRVDLRETWDAQEVPLSVIDTLYQWMPRVHEAIVDSASGRNVTEWCKKEDCWRHVQTIDVAVSSALEQVLASGQALPTVGDESGRDGSGLTATDRDNIAHVLQVSAEDWLGVVSWGASTGELQEWQMGIASTLAGYAAAGWNKVPSKKQASHGLAIVSHAREHGYKLSSESTDPA